MLEIFSLLMAHGYSGAGAVFQMPASATDVDVLCSRSCYCRPFSSFFPSLLVLFASGVLVLRAILLLCCLFLFFSLLLFLLRFRLLFLSVSDQLFLTFFSGPFSIFFRIYI